jgi:hypothetical protein
MVFIWYSYGIRGISWENHTFVSLKSAPKLTRIIFIQRIDRNFVPNKVTNECNKKNYPQSSYEFLYPYHSISWYLYIYISLSIHRFIYQSKYTIIQSIYIGCTWVPGASLSQSLGPWVRGWCLVERPQIIKVLRLWSRPSWSSRRLRDWKGVDLRWMRWIYIYMFVYIYYIHIQILRYNICGCIYEMGLSTKFHLACKMIHDEVGKLGG